MWLHIFVIGIGLLIGFWLLRFLRPSQPKLDGKLVITKDDGKIQMSFEFDNEDQIVELRNKQVVSFKVVGPERITIEEDS